MTACDCRTPRPLTPLPRCNSLPECGAVDGASSGKVLSFIPGAGAGIRLMLACRAIGPVRVCSGSQLTNVNATAKAKFVDSAKSVAVSSILPMTSVHVELIVEGVAMIRLSEPTLCLAVIHEPRGSTRDGEGVFS